MAPKVDSSPILDQAWHLLSFLREQKVTSHQLQNLFGASDLLTQMLRADLTKVDRAAFAAFLAAQSAPTGQVIHSLKLAVDHHRSVEAGVAAGNYIAVNPDITDVNFPHQWLGSEQGATIHIVKFPTTGTTAEREVALQSMGYMADMDDMLAFGEQHPQLQRQYPIIFLGASWIHPDGSREFGCLYSDAKIRFCSLTWTDSTLQWSPNCVFAVRARK